MATDVGAILRDVGAMKEGHFLLSSGRHGDRYIEKFNSTLLEPLTEAGQMLLIAQYGSTAKPGDKSPQQKIANAFINNFNDPILLTDAFHDKEKARQVVKEAFGSSFWPLLQGRAKIAKGQVRQKVGLPAGHPGT
jgi:hypothetical protein